LLFAAAFIVGSFGVAVLAAEWRQGDFDNLHSDVAALRAEVDDFRQGVRELTAALAPPTPTPTGEPTSLEAKAGATVDLKGMRLTIQTLTPQRHAGSMEIMLENIEAPAESARPDAFTWKAYNFQDLVCTTSLSGTIASLAVGEKLVFSVNWACPGTPTRSVNADNVAFTLPVVAQASGD
jgi:hypothetical protein